MDSLNSPDVTDALLSVLCVDTTYPDQDGGVLLDRIWEDLTVVEYLTALPLAKCEHSRATGREMSLKQPTLAW